MTTAKTNYKCPLCQAKFNGAECHATCGMSTGCNLVRCPNCKYEFVEEGTIANLLRKAFGLKSPSESSEAS